MIFEGKERGLGEGYALLWPLCGNGCQKRGHLSGKGGKMGRVGTLIILIADEFLEVLPVFFSVGSKSVVLLLINIHHVEHWPTAAVSPHFPETDVLHLSHFKQSYRCFRGLA